MDPMPLMDAIQTWLNTILLFASVVTLAVTVAKVFQKPNRTQDERLDELEEWKKKVDERLKAGDDHFEEIDTNNRITLESLLALMSYESDKDDNKLRQTKDKVEHYLISK